LGKNTILWIFLANYSPLFI